MQEISYEWRLSEIKFEIDACPQLQQLFIDGDLPKYLKSMQNLNLTSFKYAEKRVVYMFVETLDDPEEDDESK